MPTETISLPFAVTPALSGYTGDLTPFLFVPGFDNSHVFATDRALWDFGDGTFSTSPSATHTFNWPGIYNVRMTLFDVNETIYPSTFTRSISVVNILPNIITTLPAHKVVNIAAARVSIPLSATRINSWQSYATVSATGYTFNLYASGSLSHKLNLKTLDTNKWAHIDRTWRFAQEVVANDGTIQFLPIDNVESTNENIFYKIDNSGLPIRCLSTDTGSVFVGTSGAAQFFFIDDTPKNYNSIVPPVFLFISLDTTRFPDSYQVTSQQINQNTFFETLEIFQHVRGVIPVKIRYNAAVSIVFTSSGLIEMPLSQHKWQFNQIPFFVQLVDETGAIVDNYPPLSINTTLTASSAFNVVNLSLWCGSEQLSADFFIETNDGLPTAVSGLFRGYFIPYETCNNAVLSATVLLFNPPNAQLDAVLGWVAQPDTSTVYRITPGASSFYTFGASGLQVNIQQQQNAYEAGKNSIFSIAVAPSAAADVNVDPYAWFADADSDSLVKFNVDGTVLSSVNLSSMLFNTASATGTQNLVGWSPQSKLSPVSIALDGNNDLWMTMYDAVSSFKLNSVTGAVTQIIIPNVTNVQFLSANQLSAFGGSDLVEPSAIDTDIDNNVWVSYTHPLCGFVQKYRGTTGTILSSFSFEQGLSPGDIVVDKNNACWVTAAFNTTINPGKQTLISPITAERLVKVGDNFGRFKFTFNTTLSTILSAGVNYIVSLSGMPDPYYNGRFLVESVTGKSVTVEPNPIAWRFAATKVIAVSAYNPLLQYMIANGTVALSSVNLTATSTAEFTYSDRVYRIDTTGRIIRTDGFLNPAYITVDSSQNAWVSHHLTRVTKLNALSANITTNFTVGSAQYVLETLAQRNYIVNSSPSRELIELYVNPIQDKVFQHIQGIACDTSDNLWVINDFEGRIYFIPLNNMTLSAQVTNDFAEPLPGSYDLTRKTYQAYGDWNGFRWINKYPTIRSTQDLEGSTSFAVLPASGLYQIRKVNEDFDPSGMYKSFRFTERLINANVLFDDFIGQMVGDKDSDATTLGKLIYERIANFPANNADVETCDITALYSICSELDISIDDYQFLLPANLKRIFDLVSIKHSKLWGGRNLFDRNFNNHLSQNEAFARNVGQQVDTLTYFVTAGQNLVFKQLFNNEFKLIRTMVLNGYTPANKVYVYPLSAYEEAWGWGLEDGITGANISQLYNVYEYVPVTDQTQLEGVIDWNNDQNTLVESVSSINEWLKDDGIVDSMLDWTLRKGLGLFDP